MDFVTFMSSTAGRVARVIAGIILVVVGLLLGGTVGWILGIVGLVPLAAGIFDVCLFAPLLKQPMSGKDVRARNT